MIKTRAVRSIGGLRASLFSSCLTPVRLYGSDFEDVLELLELFVAESGEVMAVPYGRLYCGQLGVDVRRGVDGALLGQHA
jgi:hypothetical protein